LQCLCRKKASSLGQKRELNVHANQKYAFKN
jgi:hypothetical protein